MQRIGIIDEAVSEVYSTLFGALRLHYINDGSAGLDVSW